MNRRFIPWVIVVLVMLFAFALWNLVQQRLLSGDVYPPYSTLRADPLGTKVLFESLAALPGKEVSRHYRPSKYFPPGPQTTLCIFGLSAKELESDETELNSIERFVRSGGRLVIGLAANSFSSSSSPLTGTNARPRPIVSRSRRSVPFRSTMPSRIQLSERWGFELAEEPIKESEAALHGVDVARLGGGSVPPNFHWHSPGVLLNLTDTWRVLFARGSNAVVAYRSMGAGTIAISTDSYLMSNQALRDNRAPELLAWIVGPNRKIVFDETHLGVTETPGFASLARIYRLHLFFAVVLVLAGLFVWKGASSFLQAPDGPDEQSGCILGRDSASGFVSLLRRNMSPADLLKICWTEWVRTKGGQRPVSPTRMASAQQVMDRMYASESANRAALPTYQEIARILATPSARNSNSHQKS